MPDLLHDLTPPQREAVTHVDGPLLVLAGPGSGKTRVITRRIAHLVLEVGIAPWQVLAITFTNKAATEMRSRVAEYFTPRQARATTVCTFHSLCARIIRDHAERLNLPSSYSIYDTADQQRAMKQAIEACELSTTHFSPSKVLGTVSQAKNELVDAEAFAAMASDFFSKNVAKLYRSYQGILQRNKALDFDDLMLCTVRLMREHPDVLTSLRERFQYVLIDEYQDTNHAQFVIANTLAAEHRNICATGDPDQSVYRWRGADIRNILEFEQHYPQAKVVRLEQNYRSTKHILAAADALIRHNTQRKHKELWTDNEEGARVEVVCHLAGVDEAQWIVDRLRELHLREGLNWSDMAVFYRTNSLSRVIEDALRDSAVPYQIARGTAFYDRKEIKDTVAYLRSIANPADEVNLLRIVNHPARGISDKTVKALQVHAAARQCTFFEAMRDAASITSLNPRAVRAVHAFGVLLKSWRDAAQLDAFAPVGVIADDAGADTGDGHANPATSPEGDTFTGEDAGSLEDDLALRSFVERIIRESGLHDHYGREQSDTDDERLMNLGELVSSAQQFELELLDEASTPLPLRTRLEGFLERIALISDLDGVQGDKGAVTLMTLHAAKGLEFPVVAIIGVEENLLPHSQSQGDLVSVEEERRLCFVGITRARRYLYLSHARTRTIFGRTEMMMPSRFLSELPHDLVHEHDAMDDAMDDPFGADAGTGRGGGWGRQMQQPLSSAGGRRNRSGLTPGTMVRHPQFGLGTVLLVTGDRAKVDFERSGVKNLILEYARLERL